MNFEGGKVSINTVEDFENLKKNAVKKPSLDLFVGTVNIPAVLTPKEFGDTEVKDPDGEVINIKNLHLVLCGSIGDDVPEMAPGNMHDFAVAVAKTATYNQRHLPLKQKLIILWKFFAELFFDRNYMREGDPYVMVAEQWYRKQRTPAPVKQRLKIFMRRIRDMFVYTSDAEPIDTYGMPGFQSWKKLNQRS